MKIQYENVKLPECDCTNIPVQLTDETMKERLNKVLDRMNCENFDSLVIYADLEHGNNFEYLTGFLPRFEEALLILNTNGNHYMVLGNENLNKASKARIKATPIHCPYFSLPNQPMDVKKGIKDILSQCGFDKANKVGIVGWKNFTSNYEDNSQLFDVPYYIVDTIRDIFGYNIYNATRLFIGDNGARCTNNVNEIVHYEFGAALASDCILKAMNHLDVGVSEMELGDILNAYGQKNSVVTIAASGPRFIKANIYPTNNAVKLKDPISLSIGYKGGFSSRAGYAVHDSSELDESVQDYLDALVKPYFASVAVWLEKIHCGMPGGEVYDLVEATMPKAEYNWSLCPGHLTADEEWMSSNIYENSQELVQSGMLYQIDIIPSKAGYAGTSAESSVLLADETLRKQIEQEEPELWSRIQKRREYIIHELNIPLNDDVLPMCSTVAYLRPFLLNKDKAMKLQ